MRRTALALAATTVALGLTGVSHAGPSCQILKDPEGDVTPAASSLDITSADLSSDAKVVTAVIRVQKLAASDGTAPTGMRWRVQFNVPGRALPYYLGAIKGDALDGDAFEFGEIDGSIQSALGEAKGSFELANNEIRIHAPIGLDGTKKLSPGTKVDGIRAFAQRAFVVLLSGADSTAADATGTYVAGSRSCVKPGK